MGIQHPRKYTAEFKRQAVELARELGSTPKAAEQLGVPESNIHNWRLKLKKGFELPKDKRASNDAESPEEELKRLRRENQQLQKANYILKQAAAFFSQDHLK
jgi:transposase